MASARHGQSFELSYQLCREIDFEVERDLPVDVFPTPGAPYSRNTNTLPLSATRSSSSPFPVPWLVTSPNTSSFFFFPPSLPGPERCNWFRTSAASSSLIFPRFPTASYAQCLSLRTYPKTRGGQSISWKSSHFWLFWNSRLS